MYEVGKIRKYQTTKHITQSFTFSQCHVNIYNNININNQ